ncbi:MAG: prolyl oligopeptidase family serine peptidase [Hyphomonadaceae bacterium]
MRTGITIIAAAALSAAAMAQQSWAQSPPEARRADVVEVMHGVEVHDPYRWLEQIETPEVANWAAAQNSAAEAFAGAGVEARAARMLPWLRQLTVRQLSRAGERTFFLHGWSGSPDQGLFAGDPNGEAVWLDGPHAEGADASHSETSVTTYWPSPDGRYVLSLSHRLGDTWGALKLIDVASGETLAQHEGVHISVTTAAWLPDSSAYAYAAYAREDDAPVRGHVMLAPVGGAPREVFAAVTDGDARGRLITVSAAQDSGRLFVEATQGTSGQSDLYVIDPVAGAAAPRLLGGGGTGQWTLLGARGDSAWVYTNAGAPRGRVVRFDRVSAAQPHVRTVVEEREGSISATSQVGGNAVGMFDDRLALLYQENAEPIIRVFDLNGRERVAHRVPAAGAIWGGFSADGERARVFYQFLGGVEPGSIYALDLHNGRSDLITAAPGGMAREALVATRVFVDSTGGARVPVIIAHRAGLDMSQPHRTFLYGYGAFAWVSFLYYQPPVIEWLTQDDGVYVIAGIRGGGEFGPPWHEAGHGAHRQNAIDDYLAVAQYLIDQRYTSAATLVANGGSISGGLAGAAVNQRPDLFGAAVLDYAALDLIRYPFSGHARYWVDEIGSPEDPEDFQVLRALSPYHNLAGDRCPVPTLVRIGPNDHTMSPFHGYKYSAAAQAAAGVCGAPVYLDVMEGAGHNYGTTPEEIARNHAMMLEFLDRVLPAAP